MATAELDIRLYDSTGKRKRLPHGWITGAEFEVGEKGGYQNGSLSVQANWEDLSLEGTEYADIRAFGNLVYRGYAFQPQQSIDDPEKWTISLYGLMDRLNGYLVRHCYCYASAVDISTVFEDIAAEYVTLAGRLPSLVIDTTGVDALGITLTEFCAKGKSVSQAFNQLVEMAPQQLIWGCDVDSNGDDRLYLYPRSSDTSYRYSVGKDVSAFVYPRDVTQVVNKVYVSGGSADPANLAPNASFENCSAVDDNENNLFTNAGFEDVYSVSSGAGYATGWTMTGNASTGAKAFVYPDVGGANLSHAGNVWVVLDYYSLAGMQVTAGTLAQTVQIGYPQKVRAGIWARQKTADGTTSEYRDFRIKIQAKDAGGTVLETFTSATVTPSTETWTQYTFEATPTNQSVTQITVTYEQITLFNGNQNTYHLLLDDATFVAAQVTADGWRVGTSVDAFFSDLDWHTTDQAKDGSYSLLAQATITDTGGYAELCTQTDNAIDVKPGKTYYFTAWALNDTGTAPTFKLGLRQFADSTQLQEDIGDLQTLSTANTWTRYEFSVTVGSNCNKLEPFLRLYNGGRVFFDAIMVTQGASVPQNVFYVGSTFEAVRSVTDYTSGDIGTDAANSITTYGIREKEESVEHIRTLDSLEAYCKSYFRAHAVPAIQAKLTLKGVTATLGLGGKVKLLNLQDAPEPLFPSRIRYRVGESFDAEIELNNERPDLALLLRKLTANVPKGTTGTAVASNGGSTSRAGNGAVLTVAADAGTGLVGNVTLNSGRAAVLTQSGQDILVDVRGRSVADLSTLEAEANAIVFISDAMRGGFFYAYQTGTSPDNGTTFASATSGWVWKRVFQGAINPQWFGAVGDGSTDDLTALQAAINATPAGGTLLIPATANYYKITAYLSILASITIVGDGGFAEIKQATTDQGIFDVQSSDVTIDTLILTGKQYVKYRPYNGGECAIKSTGASTSSRYQNLTVQNCVIQTWGDAALSLQFVDRILIQNCVMENLNDAGVRAICCDYGIIRDCPRIANIVGDATGDGAASPPIGVNSSVYGIIITRTGDTDTTAYPRSKYWHVENNTVLDSVWEAIDTHGGQYINITSNTIANCYGGIIVNYAQSTGGTELLAPLDCTITANVIYGSTSGADTFGISINGAQNGTTVAEYAARITCTGNTVFGHGRETLQNSGAIYCRTTMGLVVSGNTIDQPSCVGIVLSHENQDFVCQGNVINDCWTNTGGNVGMGIRVYAASSVGNNIGIIAGNMFGRNTSSSGKSSGYTSICNRAIEVGNYSGNDVQVGLNKYDSVFTYKVLDTGSKASTTFTLKLTLPTSGTTGGLLINDVPVYSGTSGQLTVDGDLYLGAVNTVGGRRFRNCIGGGFNEYDTNSSVFNYAHTRMAYLHSQGGSTAVSPAASTGTLADLYIDTGNSVTWNSPSGNIVVTITLPAAWSYMRQLLISQHNLYYAQSVKVEYSTNNGSSYTTYLASQPLKGGDNMMYTNATLYTATNLKLTFSSFADASYFQLIQIGWTYYNATISPYSLSLGGGSLYGNLTVNGTLTSTGALTVTGNSTITGTLRVTGNTTTGGTNTFTATPSPTIVHRITAAASSSGIAALQMYTPDGTKNPRWHQYQDTAANACGFQINASSGTGLPDFVIYRDTTLYLQLNMNSTTGNLGRLSLPITGSGAGIMLGGDAQIFRGAADRLDLASGDSFNIVSGSLQVNGTSVLTSGRALQNIAGLTLDDATNIVMGSTTGTKYGTATTQKQAFWNATPIVQPSGAAQAAVATTAATNTTPYGYSTAAQADGVITLLNEIRSVLVNTGLMKGSA